MARIRTIKPEAFESEDLASVSLTAERTFFGLLTQADDSGRHRDHPAIIAGRLWALRPEHTATHVARDLDELASAGLLCRYTGCDGRTWLHIVTWDQHQKINKATASRLPRCPSHQARQHCGKCQNAACPSARAETSATLALTPPAGLPEDSRSSQGGRPSPVVHTPGTPEGALEPETAPVGAATGTGSTPAGKTAGQTALPEDSRRTTGGLREESRPGSRILDPGSFLTGREAPAPDASSAKVSAKQLVAEYVRGCNRRPPEDFLGHLGRKINALLDEQFEAGDIRAALDKLRAKGLNPSVLPSLVNEVVNATPQSAAALSSASGAGPWASTASSYTPYLNPTAEPTTFGGHL
ncbi:hypothetical protein GCM10010211_20510 [Streptomyces albospinus]|uniref:Uncharacterized protein n=1 Tax=Streptomyces albospinus TaxID=285515 RepID=A0ABQ2UV85_9ACTN|nr:hypothetical protein [Streptomyces albospinus]GGU55639.1 hypothetical protein GCM10010211_20510 [Streptomyces albospinus]